MLTSAWGLVAAAADSTHVGPPPLQAKAHAKEELEQDVVRSIVQPTAALGVHAAPAGRLQLALHILRLVGTCRRPTLRTLERSPRRR